MQQNHPSSLTVHTSGLQKPEQPAGYLGPRHCGQAGFPALLGQTQRRSNSSVAQGALQLHPLQIVPVYMGQPCVSLHLDSECLGGISWAEDLKVQLLPCLVCAWWCHAHDSIQGWTQADQCCTDSARQQSPGMKSDITGCRSQTDGMQSFLMRSSMYRQQQPALLLTVSNRPGSLHWLCSMA